jgi:Flp pilus assembly protein TadG
MKQSVMTRLQFRKRSLVELWRDRSGIAATEFAFIVPLMLVLFFGVVEFSQGVAVDRKVSIIARTLADLVSQNVTVVDAQFAGFYWAGKKIMDPFPSGQLKQTVSELYVDPNSHTAKVQWSNGDAAHSVGSPVTIPSALSVDGTYLILSEISYLYTPTVGYVMAKTGVNLSDVAYTRPRLSSCVLLDTSNTPCPTN